MRQDPGVSTLDIAQDDVTDELLGRTSCLGWPGAPARSSALLEMLPHVVALR